MNVHLTAPQFGGTIRAIASKSCAHRLLICAALSDAPCEIVCSDFSADIFATAQCLRAMGAEIEQLPGGFFVTPMDRSSLPEHAVLDCGESGSTLRFLLPVAGALGLNATFLLGGRLPERPLSPLYELLQAHGMTLSPQGSATLQVSGKLRGERFSISGAVSSQYISGLLFALPLLGGGCVYIEDTLESAGYVALTCSALQRAGVSVTQHSADMEVTGSYHLPARCIVEGDWSNAAVWLAAGAIGPAPVTLGNLDLNSLQGDRAIILLLERFGARVVQQDGAFTVHPAALHATEIDAAQIPDLVPVLAAVATAAKGQTRIYGAARLRAKESDRLCSTCMTLRALGAQICETEDGLLITGSPLHGGRVDSWNDHRIVMMSALCTLRTSERITIENAKAVDKSYPAFFTDFTALGGEVEVF